MNMFTRVIEVGFFLLIMLPFTALHLEAKLIVADPVSNRAERLNRFEARNSQQELKRLAQELMKAINPDTPGVKEGFTRLYKQERYKDALDAYRDYFLAKLKDPGKFGIPDMSVSPSAPYEAAVSPLVGEGDNGLVASLMQNVFIVRDLEVNIGMPGAINWTFIPPDWQARPLAPGEFDKSDNHTGDTPIIPRLEAWRTAPSDFGRHFRRPLYFKPLLAAYAQTGKKTYLDKWADYIDDWSMNQKSDADKSVYNIQLYMPQEMEYLNQFIGNLAYLSRNQPAFTQDIPSPTLVRVLLRWFPETTAAAIRQLRYFESNWRYFIARILITDGLLFSDMKISSEMIEEGRRGMEVTKVLCVLPDGSDYELTPNYWGTHLSWGYPISKLAMEGIGWGLDKTWLEEEKEYAALRARAILSMLMPSGRWPILGPQDLRMQLGDYDNAPIREITPEFLSDKDNARRLNIAFKGNPEINQSVEYGDGSTEPPSYTSEWLPYGGFYFLRSGWSKDDPFIFMKSSSHVVGHLSTITHWDNDNVASLYAYNQELMFVHHETPVTVDGMQQNTQFGLPFSGHLGFMIPKLTHPVPAPMRWHTSDAFDFAEGYYDRPYGKPGEHITARMLGKKPEKPITDVTHRRQIFSVKKLGIWIIIDRMDSKAEHDYSQLWMLHSPEPSTYGDIYGFTPEQVQIDHSQNSLRTSNPKGPNLSLYQIASAPLKMNAVLAPPSSVVAQSWTTEGRNPQFLEEGNYLFSFNISKLTTAWRGKGNQALISLIIPSKDTSDKVSTVERVANANVIGFNMTLKDGSKLLLRTAANYNATLSIGNITTQGESLLLLESADKSESGVILGSKKASFGTRTEGLKESNAEFVLKSDGKVVLTPIYKPIKPVFITPDTNVFTDSVKVKMSTATPETIIHYTLDGSDPTLQSPQYSGPVTLTETTTVKARAFRAGVKRVDPTLSGTECTVVARAEFTKQQLRTAASPAGPIAPGIAYSYYEGDWQDLLIRLDDLKPVKSGYVESLMDISAARRDRYFAFRYTGWFEAPKAGVYTFYSPEPAFIPDNVNPIHIEPGFYMSVVVDEEKWYPTTRQHAFGSWSIPLAKGKHEIEVVYADFRGGKEDTYTPNKAYGCMWEGDKPSLEISGPGMKKRQIPAGALWRKE